MDPLTQGALGAALPLATRRGKPAAVAAGCGFLAGLAPDLDIVLRDPEDTLLFLEFHRQFTHALIFIPVGSAIVAGALFGLARRWFAMGFLEIWLLCALGYSTHGILDATTSYGTLLLWPFSEERFAFNVISVIDPLFTVPVASLVTIGVLRKDGRWARGALGWAVLYLALGTLQHQSAVSMAYALAESRGHGPSRLIAKPTFGNILLWRTVYETADRFHVDAVRPGPWPRSFSGAQATKLDVKRDFPWLDPASQQARDIGRFRRFSQNFNAKAPDGSNRVIDVRYGFLPTEISALWSIKLDREAAPEVHAVYETDRSNARAQLPRLLGMVFGGPPD
jgi:inner membrane protein